jgi:hypothetical protein
MDKAEEAGVALATAMAFGVNTAIHQRAYRFGLSQLGWKDTGQRCTDMFVMTMWRLNMMHIMTTFIYFIIANHPGRGGCNRECLCADNSRAMVGKTRGSRWFEAISGSFNSLCSHTTLAR